MTGGSKGTRDRGTGERGRPRNVRETPRGGHTTPRKNKRKGRDLQGNDTDNPRRSRHTNERQELPRT